MPAGTSDSIDSLLDRARARMDASEAALLMAHVLGQPLAWLFAHGEQATPADAAARFDALVERRAAGEPIAYLTGRRGFWTLDLQVGPDTLIPRPETELLVEQALARLPADGPARIADLGTGSGAVGLAIATERPAASVLATDVSDAALAVARANAAAAGLENIEFRQGDWWAPLQGERFDLLASNPPYVAEEDPHLEQGDLRFEPTLALVSGYDGLDAIRLLAAGAPVHLNPGGWLLLEHGLDQGPAVRALLRDAGLVQVGTARDLEQRDRVTFGRRRPSD